jgi:hypothetical protein
MKSMVFQFFNNHIASTEIAYDVSHETETQAFKPEKETTKLMLTAPDTRLGFDGLPPIAGFTFARDPIPPFREFKGPRVPSGFTPLPPLAPRTRPPALRTTAKLDPEARRDILDEEKLDGPIQRYIASKPLHRVDPNDMPPPPPIPELASNILLSLESAKQASKSTYRPYAANPAKNTRYSAYLDAIVAENGIEEMRKLFSEAELIEFQKSGDMFQGLSSLMSKFLYKLTS